VTLTERLSSLRDRAMQTARGQAAWRQVMERLVASQAETGALDVGDQIPDFLLPNSDGRLVSSPELLARGPLVISFFRGGWCPWCRATLEAFQGALPEIEAAGANLVALIADTRGQLVEMRDGLGLSFDLLCDVDHGVALRFGVLFRLPSLYREGLAANHVDLVERQGIDGWFVPIPATYIVDPGGIIRWRYLNIDYTQRPEPDAMIAPIRALVPVLPR